MNQRTPLKVGIVGASLLFAGVLVGSVDQTPVSWMRTALLETLGAQIPEVFANQLQGKEMGESPLLLAKALPGLKGKSKQEIEMEKFAKPIPPGQLKRYSRAERLDACLKQPQCRAEHEKAVAGKGKRPKNALRGLPEESQQDKELQRLFPQPQNPQAPLRGPRSELLMPEEPSALLSWLNPFGASVAHALVSPPLDVHLIPGKGGRSGPALLYMFGSRLDYNGNNYLFSNWTLSPFASYSDNEPFAYVRLYVAAGQGSYYDLSFQATAGEAKLRHQYGGPIIKEWDFNPAPTGWPGLYATKKWLDPGYHYFFFYPAPGSPGLRFQAVDITSWP